MQRKDGIRLSREAGEGAKSYGIHRLAQNRIDAGRTTFERRNDTTGTTYRVTVRGYQACGA